MTDGGERERETLARLGARLKRARQSSRIVPHRPGRAGPPSAGLGIALRIGVEMVAGVAVGAGIGYLLDQWFGTSPWLLIVFFFLGAGAGGLNTYRAITGSGFGLVSAGEAEGDEDEDGKGDRGS